MNARGVYLSFLSFKRKQWERYNDDGGFAVAVFDILVLRIFYVFLANCSESSKLMQELAS